MLYREISRILSFFLAGLSIPLLLPLGIALWCEWFSPVPQPPCAWAFLATIGVTLALGALFWWFGKNSSSRLYRREAFLLLLLVYLLLSAVSALPFCFSKTLPNYLDACFESVSGYTTTGATVMEGKRYADGKEIPIVKKVEDIVYSYSGTITPYNGREGIEAAAPALLVWRSLTQFLGGGGIVILFLALLPVLGVGGKVLYQAETTGPSKETMAPRITETASWLWKIYLGWTVLEIILLMVTNPAIPFFEALAISFSTISTGGFAPRNASIASYNNPYTDLVVMLFMIIGSINFSIYFFCMKGKFYRLKDRELWVFLLILFFAALFAAIMLVRHLSEPLCNPTGTRYTFWQGFLQGAFQTISAQTSTGFATANIDFWPQALQVVMFILMFVGGMAGSTAGGIKVVRFQIFFRAVQHKVESIFRPDAVRTLRIGTKPIEEKVVTTALSLLAVVVAFVVAGTFLFVLDGIDTETALTTAGAMVNNVGFGFRMASPEHSFAFLSPFSKIISIIWMIAGRLEYFALLVVLLPAFWKGK